MLHFNAENPTFHSSLFFFSNRAAEVTSFKTVIKKMFGINAQDLKYGHSRISPPLIE